MGPQPSPENSLIGLKKIKVTLKKQKFQNDQKEKNIQNWIHPYKCKILKKKPYWIPPKEYPEIAKQIKEKQEWLKSIISSEYSWSWAIYYNYHVLS